MEENIKRQDLKQIIIDTMNDVYIDKNKLCEILENSMWSEDKDYKVRYLDLWHKICDLIGREYYEIWRITRGNKCIVNIYQKH